MFTIWRQKVKNVYGFSLHFSFNPVFIFVYVNNLGVLVAGNIKLPSEFEPSDIIQCGLLGYWNTIIWSILVGMWLPIQ